MQVSTEERTIMLIDDSDVARAITAAKLRAAGFKVFERPSPLGATLDLIRRPVDAVLIDIDMPMMRGDAFATLLRRNVRLDPVAVVLLSGCSPRELTAALENSGADAAVGKDMSESTMVHTVDRAIARRRSMMPKLADRAAFPPPAKVSIQVTRTPKSGEYPL